MWFGNTGTVWPVVIRTSSWFYFSPLALNRGEWNSEFMPFAGPVLPGSCLLAGGCPWFLTMHQVFPIWSSVQATIWRLSCFCLLDVLFLSFQETRSLQSPGASYKVMWTLHRYPCHMTTPVQVSRYCHVCHIPSSGCETQTLAILRWGRVVRGWEYYGLEIMGTFWKLSPRTLPTGMMYGDGPFCAIIQ